MVKGPNDRMKPQAWRPEQPTWDDSPDIKTSRSIRGKMARMNRVIVSLVLLLVATSGLAFAQKDKDEEPTSWVYFNVIKDDNGKPVRNAAVILHAVDNHGKQERGDLELKTDPEGKTNFDGIPYGKLRVQVLAHGFQTYGEDFDVEQSKTEITIKLKRPQGQYSIYENHPGSTQKDPPQADDSKKPN